MRLPGRRSDAGRGASTSTESGRGGPWRENPWGAGLLLLLSAVAGGVDAITFLFVGNTFVSNQTGNIMLLAMNAAGAQAADVGAAIVSLIGFVVGAALTGRLVREGLSGPQAPTRIPTVLWLEVALISIGTLINALTDLSARLTVAPLAVAMGMQATLGARIALLYLTPGSRPGSWSGHR